MATQGSSTYNLINSIPAATILCVPICFARTGYVFGFLIHIVSSIISHYAYVALVAGSDLVYGSTTLNFTHSHDYQTVMKKVFGTGWGYLTSITILIFCALTMVGDCIVLKDNMFWFASNDNFDQSLVMWGIIIFIMLPLGLFEDLDKLWITSLLCIVCQLYTLFFIFISMLLIETGVVPFQIPSNLPAIVPAKMIPSNWIAACESLVQYIMCYSGHYNALLVYKELGQRNFRKFTIISGWTCYLIWCVNVGIGIGGVLVFGENVNADVLIDYSLYSSCLPQLEVWADIAHVAMMIVMTAGFPALLYSFRTTFNLLVVPKGYILRHKHQVITVIVVCILIGLASTWLTTMGNVLDLASALGGIPFTFAFPGFLGMMFLKWSMKKKTQKHERIYGAERVNYCFTMFVGFFGAIMTPFLAVLAAYIWAVPQCAYQPGACPAPPS